MAYWSSTERMDVYARCLYGRVSMSASGPLRYIAVRCSLDGPRRLPWWQQLVEYLKVLYR